MDLRATRPAGRALLLAAEELRFLLDRGYPRERALGLAGDRHALSAQDREMLRRGVFGQEIAARRERRRLGMESIRGLAVALDGHNVLITLETALGGGRLLLADDGWVRDVSQVGRNHRPGELTRRAGRLMLEALKAAGAGKALICLDAPLPKSGELAAWLREQMAALGLAGGALALAVPEKRLLGHRGPVASSDGAVIEAVKAPLDLAGEIIKGLDPAPRLERLFDEPA